MEFEVDEETGIVTLLGTEIAFESSSEIPNFLARVKEGRGWTASRTVRRWKYDESGNPVEVRVYGWTPV